MTVASEIAALGPVAHWPFSDVGATVDGTTPIPNEARVRQVDGGVRRQAYSLSSPACAGDVRAGINIAKPSFGNNWQRSDYRAPRGAYRWKWDGLDPGDFAVDWEESLEDETSAPIPFSLFSQPFTLLYEGGWLSSQIQPDGLGHTPFSAPVWACTLWYGSGVNCLGHEATNGSWAGFGRINNSSLNTSSIFVGCGDDVRGITAGPKSRAYINAFVYDPSASPKVRIFGDGGYSYSSDAPGVLSAYELLASQQPKLHFYTGWCPADVTSTSPPPGEGDPQTAYPWHSSHSLSSFPTSLPLANVALFDRALGYKELGDFWFDGVGGGCDSWGGWTQAVPSWARINGSTVRLDGSSSITDLGYSVVSYEWRLDSPDGEVIGTGVTLDWTHGSLPRYVWLKVTTNHPEQKEGVGSTQVVEGGSSGIIVGAVGGSG